MGGTSNPAPPTGVIPAQAGTQWDLSIHSEWRSIPLGSRLRGNDVGGR